ncbi:MAG: GDSL-type esterase/lipase family protein [Microcoleaceae cyanobacterium]
MFIRLKTIPTWAALSLMGNGLLLLWVVLLNMQGRTTSNYAQVNPSAVFASESNNIIPSDYRPAHRLGPKHRWTYQQWVTQLRREAQAAAEQNPQHLTVLAGDSLSLWFPPQLLPDGRTWLNQGISGETSAGLLKRLKLLDVTSPETIFVMIGINDLLRGIDNETLLQNSQAIIQELRWAHPNAEIVVQSILPHSDEKATWEGRDRLINIPNRRIRYLNRELRSIAEVEGVFFLDLHPLFTDERGQLRPELSTDGLHLNEQGYLVWSSGLQLFSQMELQR